MRLDLRPLATASLCRIPRRLDHQVCVLSRDRDRRCDLCPVHGSRHQPVQSRPHPSNTNRPRASVDVQVPDSGMVTQTLLIGRLSWSWTIPPKRYSSTMAPRGPSSAAVLIVCVRTSGPRTKTAPDEIGQSHGEVDGGLVGASDRRPEICLLLHRAAQNRLDRPYLRKPAVQEVGRQPAIRVQDREQL